MKIYRKAKVIMAKIKFSLFLSKEKIIDPLIRAVLIFTSVFLALWLTEIRESQNTKKIVGMALENFASEIKYGIFEGDLIR